MITMLTHHIDPPNADSTNTGSTETGSTETGSTGTGSTNTGSTTAYPKNADPAVPDGSIEPPIERELDIAAAAVDGRSDRAIRLALGVGRWLPRPGVGQTALRWRSLTALAAGDLTAARVIEAHTDALAILAEAATEPAVEPVRIADIGATDHSTWGVFAAEGAGVRVDATRNGDRWLLSGTKPWCSLAERLSHALITAHTPEGGRRLFAIDLRSAGVRAAESGWVARGLVEVPSGPIDLLDVVAVPIGPDGWYLRRPGFAWGGIGVAACWYGGAVGVARTMREAMSVKEPDQIAAMHLGAVDAELAAARAVLAESAVLIDGGAANGSDGVLLAARSRATVARVAENVLERAGHALGPAPLARDERHSRRVADLQLYLRQHHAERDEAALGRAVLDLTEWV